MIILQRIIIYTRIKFRKLIDTEKIFYHINRYRFWDNKAKYIDKEWGQTTEDFEVLEKLISKIKTKKILDFGCGSGRIFPLYLKLNIEEIVGIDVSETALKIAGNRYKNPGIKLQNSDIFGLNKEEKYFDLIVSNRVLQHVLPGEINKVIKKLTFLSNNVYINEMTDTDKLENVFYIFQHNYEEIFGKYNFTLAEKGNIGNQTYYLFVNAI